MDWLTNDNQRIDLVRQCARKDKAPHFCEAIFFYLAHQFRQK